MDDESRVISLLTQLPLLLPAFALVLFRVAGLMLAAPLFGSPVVPVRFRILLAGVISLALFPLVGSSVPANIGFLGAIVGVFGEMLIGLTLGVSVGLVLMGAELAGELAGQQAGLSLGQIINPFSDSESTVFAQVYAVVFQAVFLSIGGHRALMRCLLDTYAVIPPASFRADARLTQLMADLLAGSFILALRLAAPVLIAMFLASVIMGLLSRSIPQLNILTIGFAFRAILAVFLGAVALSASGDVFQEALGATLDLVRSVFGLAAAD